MMKMTATAMRTTATTKTTTEPDTIYRAKLALSQSHIAEVVNEALRAYDYTRGERPRPPWLRLHSHLRDRMVRAVAAVLAGEVTCAEERHAQWTHDKTGDGWTLGPYSSEARTHPQLVPWAELKLKDRRRHYLFVAIVQALGRGL